MKFNNYYRKLMEYYNKNAPEEYSMLEDWGMTALNQELNEGLITTYPREAVVKYLNKIGVVEISDNVPVPNQHIKSNSIVFRLTPSLIVKPNLIDYLNKGLYVYGWRVSGEVDSQKDTLTIEPIFSHEYVPSRTDNFYHVTHEMFIPKIQKIGLVPRETTTLFSHPGNRIYVIQTDSIVTLNSLSGLLLTSRLKKATNKPKSWVDEWIPEKMVAININIDGLKLFEDPMSPSKKGSYKTCFTKQNIHPDKIGQIHELNQ